ncbi:hypothetical protein [Paenibacillus cremeus]|uniref:Phage portal protein n=1 Tax=Paenibacillus cremeus TaxID=2163881 RepID=A0A559KCV9_9BACL|nr:hypothetical protein [Paenibacillus cremeus]TVY09961.1 hypothetical protein FPZ49_11360 [Paenibacillus cremeus]
MKTITEQKKRGRPPKQQIDTNSMVDTSYYELAAYFDFISTSAVGRGIIDININNLMNWLRNPPKFRRELIQLSKYYYNRDGVVTDCYDLFNVLPVLNFSVLWQNMNMKAFTKNKLTVDTFLEKIKVKKLVRDTIFSVIQEGTCVWYNRDNKYIQFLENEEYMIDYMVNGKWQVFYDMLYIDQYRTSHNLDYIMAKIDSAPDEVTLEKYNLYKKDNKKYRYVPLDIDKTQVFKLRGSRNEPYGIPYSIPAISSIIHRDLLEKTEKAVADRIINQIIVQKVGNMPSADGKVGLPVPKATVEGYHTNLKNLLQKKFDTNSSDNAATAPLTVPSFVDIEELKINMSTFPKEIWERIDRDIYKKLGFSSTLNMGGGTGQSFGSGTINVEKVYSIVFYIIEDIESALNEFLGIIVPSGNFNPKIRFSRATILDKDSAFTQAESLYLKGRGSLKDYVEASGRDFDHWLAQVRYENEVLKLDETLPIHVTSFTQSGDGNSSGRPSVKNPTNDNTAKSKGNNGNAKPDM